MDEKKLVLGILGVIAGAISYRVYLSSGIASAVSVLLIASWTVLYAYNNRGKGFFSILGMLISPFHSAIILFLAGLTYFSYIGYGFWPSLFRGLVVSIAGSALAMWLNKYWNIGG